MDASNTPSQAAKPVDTTPQSSEQTEVSPSPAVPKKPAPKVPDGYKIVKVRKPDGAIIKVLRPIQKDGAPSSSPSKSDGESAKTNTGAPSETQTPKQVDAHPAKAQALLPATQESQKAAVAKFSGAVPSDDIPKTAKKVSATVPSATSKKTEATAEKTPTPPVHSSKLDAVSKSARIYRRFHQVHKHASRLVEAFDPYSDVGDYQDGDISMPDDSDDDSDSDSADSDTKDNAEQNHKSGSRSTTQGVTTSTPRQATTNRPAPAAKATKTDVSVHGIPDNKSSSTELTKEALVLEKEVLPTNGAEQSNPGEHGLRGLTKRSTHWAKLIAWALVIFFPLAFIGLGIATATLDGKPSSFAAPGIKDWLYEITYDPTTRSVIITHATKVAITAWLIVFAAILAQTLKAVATYRVERGIRLMTLEQLISSHSVAAAIKQPFVLRKLNWLTVVLMGLWALSPLGSQSMQYTTNQIANMNSSHGTIYYLNTAQENPGLSNGLEASDIYSDSMDVLYAAVFQEPSPYQPTGSDPWGNALIPIYEYLAPPNSTNSTSPPTITGIDPFSQHASYYGIPLADFSDYDGAYSGTWNFTIRASYLYLDCPPLRFETMDQINLDLDEDMPDTTYDDLFKTSTGSLAMEMVPPNSTHPAGSLTFVSNCSAIKTPNGEHTWAYAFCNLSQTFVDADVSCVDANCTVQNITKIPVANIQPTNMTDFIDEFLSASDTGLTDYPEYGNTTFSVTELWIRNASNATEPGAGDYCDLSVVSQDDFTINLAYLLNTYYSTGFTHDYQVGSIIPNQTVTLSDYLPNTSYTIILTNHTHGVHYYQSDTTPMIFKIDIVFLTLFMFCAVMLLLIGVAGILLESETISPDILGFASNLARHSKYVKLPHVDGTMSGAERAKKLGDVRVMMQDVKADAEIGKIVLGNVHESAQRLRRGRVYR